MEITTGKIVLGRASRRLRFRLSYLIQLGELLTLWYQRRKQRYALLQLNDRMLSDIGISRCDAEQEGTKPFWKG